MLRVHWFNSNFLLQYAPCTSLRRDYTSWCCHISEGTISQCTLQLVNTTNILSNIITHRILNAMVGFSRVFQVLATCKKVWTFKVFQNPFDSLDEKTNHYGDNFWRCVLSQLSVFSLGIVWIERICKTLKTVFQPISKHIQDCL